MRRLHGKKTMMYRNIIYEIINNNIEVRDEKVIEDSHKVITIPGEEEEVIKTINGEVPEKHKVAIEMLKLGGQKVAVRNISNDMGTKMLFHLYIKKKIPADVGITEH